MIEIWEHLDQFIHIGYFHISAQQVVICVRLALQEGAKGEWTSHFGGYVITLLVIFYLQIEKKLPSVLSLQKGVTPVIKCGGELDKILDWCTKRNDEFEESLFTPLLPFQRIWFNSKAHRWRFARIAFAIYSLVFSITIKISTLRTKSSVLSKDVKFK